METEKPIPYSTVIKEIYNNSGVRGFYKGYWATFWRDVPSYGLMFFSYDYMQRMLYNEKDNEYKAYLKKMLAAGCAGILNWVPTYPADVVKSII